MNNVPYIFAAQYFQTIIETTTIIGGSQTILDNRVTFSLPFNRKDKKLLPEQASCNFSMVV